MGPVLLFIYYPLINVLSSYKWPLSAFINQVSQLCPFIFIINHILMNFYQPLHWMKGIPGVDHFHVRIYHSIMMLTTRLSFSHLLYLGSLPRLMFRSYFPNGTSTLSCILSPHTKRQIILTCGSCFEALHFSFMTHMHLKRCKNNAHTHAAAAF